MVVRGYPLMVIVAAVLGIAPAFAAGE